MSKPKPSDPGDIQMREEVAEYCRAGKPLVIVWRGRSASGMARYYDVYLVMPFGSQWAHIPMNRYTYSIAQWLGYTYNDMREALVVNGGAPYAGDGICDGLKRALGLAEVPTYQEI